MGANDKKTGAGEIIIETAESDCKVSATQY
jgi:hypothetical protein